MLGYPAIPIEEYRFLVGNGADVLMRGMLRRTAGNYTEEDVQRLRAVYNGLYEADPVRDVQNYPGMPELVAALRREQVPAAVPVSYTHLDVYKRQIHGNLINIFNIFSVCIICKFTIKFIIF